MKRIYIFALVLLIAAMTGCSVKTSGTVDNTPSSSAALSPAGPSVPTPTEPSSAEASQTPPPSESPLLSDNGDEKKPVDADIPDPLGNQWYDFDKVGAYPGSSVVQCGNKIAFDMLIRKGEMDYDSYLAFADPDGKNCLRTKIKDPSYPNYKDGWVYFIIYKNSSIYKVKPDGTCLTRIFRAKRVPGATEILLSGFLLVENKMYFFENVMYKNDRKSLFLKMNLDGSDQEVLDGFDHTNLKAKVFSSDSSPSLFYDAGSLYYTDTDLDNSRFGIYQFDISKNVKACLNNNIASDYNSKIAVRGDKIFYQGNDGLHVYTISTGKDEAFEPTKGVVFFDFGFFDRWLLMTGDDGLYCYDISDKKLYHAGGSGNVLDIMPTQNYLYLEEGEDYPYLYQLIFKVGKVIEGDDINVK